MTHVLVCVRHIIKCMGIICCDIGKDASVFWLRRPRLRNNLTILFLNFQYKEGASIAAILHSPSLSRKSLSRWHTYLLQLCRFVSILLKLAIQLRIFLFSPLHFFSGLLKFVIHPQGLLFQLLHLVSAHPKVFT
mmetsp:Transcript_43411/g.72269  ORF Transcript_43411/g.72269 Transcript_43411/m.72269 type:complete len:134 (+) Transcript_43411:258-659(+)